MVERDVEFVDRLRAEGIAYLGAVEGNSHRARINTAVVGDVVEVETDDVLPGAHVKQR